MWRFFSCFEELVQVSEMRIRKSIENWRCREISISADFLHFVNRAEEAVQENIDDMALADLDVHAHGHAGLEGDFFVADDEGLFGERDFGRETVKFLHLAGWQDIGADIVDLSDDVTEFALREGIHLDLAR